MADVYFVFGRYYHIWYITKHAVTIFGITQHTFSYIVVSSLFFFLYFLFIDIVPTNALQNSSNKKKNFPQIFF
jgi:hypothetical protein